MIFSNNLMFSENQAITATADSTNVVDLGTPGTPYGAAAALEQDIGKGTPVHIRVQVTETFATLTSLTINISVGAAATLGTKIAAQTIAVANLVAGATFDIPFLPMGVDQRYLGLEYVVTGSNATTGKITAGITMGNQTNS